MDENSLMQKLMVSKKIMDRHNDTPRPGYNFSGDKSMNRVIINSKF